MKPHLRLKSEFESVLKDYRVSDEFKQLLADTKLLLLTSPTSSGRNTIIEKLVETGKYSFVISDTTRPPRSNNGVLEENGNPYWFKSEEEFLEGLKAGRYLEAEIIHNQQVSGASVDELQRVAAEGKIAVHEMEYGGITNVSDAMPHVPVVLVVPPSPEEWMRRLKNRGDMTETEIQNRINTAEKVLEAGLERGYKLLINDDLEVAVGQLRGLVEQGRYSQQDHEHARMIAQQMLTWVKQHVSPPSLNP